MAEAARTTRHYVSDSLAERYPYDASKGFAGARQKDVGAVFNGYDAVGTANLMNSLTDPSVSEEAKAKAAHHLYSRSASQETKIDMLQRDLVPLLVATLRSASSMLLIHQCLLLLRSLAVLPQGCYALVFQGAISPTVAALRTSTAAATSGEEEAQKCHTAAAHVLNQISSNVSGLRWLLGLEHATAVAGLQADPIVTLMPPEELVQAVVEVLAREKGSPTPTAAHLLHVLAHLTSLPRGVEALLTAPEAIPTVAVYVKSLTAPAPSSSPPQEASGETALEVVWNVALDPSGEAALENNDVVQLLFDVFACKCQDVGVSAVPLHRQLTGALSAVYQLTSVKLASTAALFSTGSETRITALVQYVRRWDTFAGTHFTAASKPAPNGVVAILKNSVQCIRLASEVKAVRDATHAIVDELEKTSAAEALDLRRRLYFGTKWEAEYKASVTV